jgi:hypothetical protein
VRKSLDWHNANRELTAVEEDLKAWIGQVDITGRVDRLELVQVDKASFTARAKVQRQPALGDDPDPAWAKDLVEAVAAGIAGPVRGPRQPRLPHLPGEHLLPRPPRRLPGHLTDRR